MSKRAIKAWPYLAALLVLAMIALFSEEYMPYDLFSKDKRVEEEAPIEMDSAEVVVTLPLDETDLDTSGYKANALEPIGTTDQKAWRLVVASVPSKERAESIVASIGNGATVKYVEYLDTYRVVYNSYSSLSEAQNGFDDISHKHPKAWLVYF